MKSRLLMFLLSAVFFFTIFSTSVAADTEGDYQYTVSSGEAKITDYTGSAASLSIPATLGGYPVTTIESSAFSECLSLTSVTIPDSVEIVDSSAFSKCTWLASITIPNSVTEIGSGAFYKCSSLNNINLPNNITEIQSGTFSYCTSLTNIEIPDTVSEIGSHAFSNCSKLTSITIPPNVTIINQNTFRSCNNLRSVIIPDNVTRIENEAFYSCSRLKSITFPESLTYIGENTFENCSGLYFLSIPANVTDIGSGAFYDCIGLSDVAFQNDNIRIYSSIFLDYSHLVFYCNDPSTAKNYAIKHDITYKPLNLFPYGTGPVSEVILSKNSLILTPGNSSTLIATIFPTNADKKNVQWSSSNLNVATVDNNGKVTAVAAGKAVITVKTADGNFSDSCTVTVTDSMIFTDVLKNQWYFPYVTNLTSKGILNGKGGGIFDPNGNIKRCEFIMILATISGEEIKIYSGRTNFSDINQDAWYAKCVNWAYNNHIVSGYTPSDFGPNANITRQEMAVMIKRYVDYKGITLPQTVAKKTFADDKDIAFWSKDAVMAMQQATIIKGKEGNIFDPDGNATRAEAATMISIFLSII